jgi:hypothetical protein
LATAGRIKRGLSVTTIILERAPDQGGEHAGCPKLTPDLTFTVPKNGRSLAPGVWSEHGVLRGLRMSDEIRILGHDRLASFCCSFS